LNWASRLVDVGVPCIIFDQPGHYLGSFHEVSNWEDFRDHAHEIFYAAYIKLKEVLEIKHPQTIQEHDGLILGGHSLGAFTALKAMDLDSFAHLKKVAVGVGIGIGQSQATHLFETAFYEKTLSLRRQLVSPHLDSKRVFSWLKNSKENLDISHHRIHLITGEDDIVVGHGGLEALMQVLENNFNSVSFETPKRLPHHEPSAATPHLYAFLKNHFGWR
jgi:hypothetical protein